jgi:hypothetical protein
MSGPDSDGVTPRAMPVSSNVQKENTACAYGI